MDVDKISSHRSKFNVNISKQAHNIAVGYDRPLPEVLVDEKLQNFFDTILDDIKIGRKLKIEQISLKIVLNIDKNQITFYQLNTHGITHYEWIEGIFKLGGETKDISGATGGAFGQGWKTWLAFCKEIYIYSNPIDISEKPGYTIISWYSDKEGNYIDPNPFADEDSDAVYKEWIIPKGNILENCAGSVWIFKLFNKEEDKNRLPEYISSRLDELKILDFPKAIRNVLYSRYYLWVNRPELKIVMEINEGNNKNDI